MVNESPSNRRNTAWKQTITDVLAELGRVHGPQWEARSDFVRNLVAIAAAIFAGTITFSDQLLIDFRPELSWIVLVCWLLFLLSIGAGLYALWHGARLQGFPAWFFYMQKDVEKAFAALPANATTEDEIAIFQPAVEEVVHRVDKSDKRGAFSAGLCVWLFCGALALLFAYAIWRFGFQSTNTIERENAGAQNRTAEHQALDTQRGSTSNDATSAEPMHKQRNKLIVEEKSHVEAHGNQSDQ